MPALRRFRVLPVIEVSKIGVQPPISIWQLVYEFDQAGLTIRRFVVISTRRFGLSSFSCGQALRRLCVTNCMQVWQQLLASVGVGLLWGCTNPLMRQGALHLQRKQQSSAADGGSGGSGIVGTINAALRTPLLILPQALGAAGGVAFAALLGIAPLSLAVPAANGASLLTAAAGDWLLGDRMDLRLTIPGVACVVAGITLCSL